MATTPTLPGKKRLRFREEDDLSLLQQAAALNPLRDTEQWNVIREPLLALTGKDFSIKTLKDHLQLLIKLWLEKNKLLENKSGIEEIYSEKDNLCQTIYGQMIEESESTKKATQK